MMIDHIGFYFSPHRPPQFLHRASDTFGLHLVFVVAPHFDYQDLLTQQYHFTCQFPIHLSFLCSLFSFFFWMFPLDMFPLGYLLWIYSILSEEYFHILLRHSQDGTFFFSFFSNFFNLPSIISSRYIPPITPWPSASPATDSSSLSSSLSCPLKAAGCAVND